MRSLRLIILLVAAAFSAGCSTLGVYESDFSCPASYNGRCISMQGAYDIAKKGQDSPEFDPAVKKDKKKSCENDEDSCGDDSENELGRRLNSEEVAHVSYKESLFKKFDGLLKEPTTPVVAPPQVMRVLLLPYKGEGNELYMLRHVYFFLDEPRWILGDSLVAIEED